MRYRKLDANGDYTWGGGLSSFFIDKPEAVAQAAGTRLRLQLGEWFLDITDGTPWQTQVLGKYTGNTRDLVLKSRVLGTTGAVSLASYSSQVGVTGPRGFTVQMTLNTIYGAVRLEGPV